MPTDHRERLARIRRFDQLVAYLRDELGWPIDSDDFEELTFEYTPEELGIDTKNAAKIQEIKRLRPLVPGQPWGIFFVKFEPKRLPVVALRRILGQVALKKRASANKSERQAWAADDLLFVSNYGEGEERRIAFAHFSKPRDGHDLPTLKVLGWDNLDTPLHLDAVASELATYLVWPDDEGDPEAWRQRWRAAFKLRHGEVITTSKELSERLAELARATRDRIRTALAIETESAPLTKLMKAFKTALVHDLDGAGFADMYAQTIAYGLLSARITDPARRTADDFAAHMRTNPFLRELMEAFLRVGGRRGKAGGQGIDFDELGVSEVVELLDQANMEAVVRDFGDRNPQEDPVIHFYEHFLAAYDKKQKVSRGVFYTPRPVVSYIVRSVDELLRIEFGLTDGLADSTTWGEMAKRHEDLKIPEGTSPTQAFVQILDPATGTGTFLVEVIDLIHKTMVKEWKSQGHGEKKILTLWNEYVPKHLLPRLHGYELLMAPYAIAHLKIGLKLFETGYRFESDERARVYLTNALEPAGDEQLMLDFLPALAHEATAVNEIKRKQRFTVVIGNPPYSGVSSNMGPWIDGLLKGRLLDGTATASYYHVDGEPLGERKVWLQDDYVKFIRLSQWLLDGTGVGVHGYLSNHGYLDNPTFRGMRWSLMQSFRRIRVLDLHGNLKKKEAPPGGGRDVNVFDIQQGVAIGLFTKAAAASRCVCHTDLWGEREQKYRWLREHGSADTEWVRLEPGPSFHLFKPFDDAGTGAYYGSPAINEVMPVNSVGIVTARDHLTIHFDPETAWETVSDFSRIGEEAARAKYRLRRDVQSWKVRWAQDDVRASGPSRSHLAPIVYRPFDRRWTYYTGKSGGFICRPIGDLMPHMLAGENVALMTCRQSIGNGWKHLLATRLIQPITRWFPIEHASEVIFSPFTSIRGLEVQIHRCSAAGPRARTAGRRTWIRGSSSRLQPPPNCDSSATVVAISGRPSAPRMSSPGSTRCSTAPATASATRPSSSSTSPACHCLEVLSSSEGWRRSAMTYWPSNCSNPRSSISPSPPIPARRTPRSAVSAGRTARSGSTPARPTPVRATARPSPARSAYGACPRRSGTSTSAATRSATSGLKTERDARSRTRTSPTIRR